MWRIAWYGDKDAKNNADGGVLTSGVDPTLFTMADGFWKRIFAIAAGNSNQYTEISANDTASYATQKSGLLTKGVVTSLFEKIRYTETIEGISNLFQFVQTCDRPYSFYVVIQIAELFPSSFLSFQTVYLFSFDSKPLLFL